MSIHRISSLSIRSVMKDIHPLEWTIRLSPDLLDLNSHGDIKIFYLEVQHSKNIPLQFNFNWAKMFLCLAVFNFLPWKLVASLRIHYLKQNSLSRSCFNFSCVYVIEHYSFIYIRFLWPPWIFLDHFSSVQKKN
jgi:hypothetical protein